MRLTLLGSSKWEEDQQLAACALQAWLESSSPLKFEGVRYRPTLLRTPTEANLRRAREQLVGIKARIAAGTFSFAEEFPDYVHLGKVPRAGSPRTCNQIFDDFLAHCTARVAKNDMAKVT